MNNIYKIYVIFFALFISFLWGLQPVIHKVLLKHIDPKTILIISSFFYTSCIILFAIYNYKEFIKDLKIIDTKSFIVIGITAIFSAFIANLIYFYILKNNESYIVSALIYSSPVFTLILAYFFLKEKITLYGFIGLIFIVIGILFIAKNEEKELFVDLHY